MIWASIKMCWQDKRLMLPSVLTVFTNLFFAALLFLQAKSHMGANAGNIAQHAQQLMQNGGQQASELLRGGGQEGGLMGLAGLNGPMDQSGFSALSGMSGLSADTMLISMGIIGLWWLTNRFLEGVTTALVYSHLTEGAGSGKMSLACQAVLSSLPAIMALGAATILAKAVSRFLRNKRQAGGGVFGFGLGFLANIVEVFWTLAGHLILPAIVIEGTSFWGALKRADRIASGNLLTIGVGEVGVDVIFRVAQALVYGVGMLGILGGVYVQTQLHFNVLSVPLIAFALVAWCATVVIYTAVSIYIRAAFYTCLYVWAIEVEAVHEAQRVNVNAPAPLAAALA